MQGEKSAAEKSFKKRLDILLTKGKPEGKKEWATVDK